MTDKDKIKFAIRYLKKGLKSKRTPPLYEELMKELGFVSEKELGKVEGKLTDLTSEYYDLEKAYNETEELLDKQIEATYKLFEENKEAKEIIKELLFTSNELDENTRSKAEQFLKENNDKS